MQIRTPVLFVGGPATELFVSHGEYRYKHLITDEEGVRRVISTISNLNKKGIVPVFDPERSEVMEQTLWEHFGLKVPRSQWIPHSARLPGRPIAIDPGEMMVMEPCKNGRTECTVLADPPKDAWWKIACI